MIQTRCAAVWSRLRYWAEETWGRHVGQRELYRLLDQMRAECKVRTAWVEELTEEEQAAFLRRLAESVQTDGERLPVRGKRVICDGGSSTDHDASGSPSRPPQSGP